MYVHKGICSWHVSCDKVDTNMKLDAVFCSLSEKQFQSTATCHFPTAVTKRWYVKMISWNDVSCVNWMWVNSVWFD